MKLSVVIQLVLLISLGILEAQDFLDELANSRRLNGEQTVKAFGEAGNNAKLSTLTILSDKKAIALATIIDSEGYCVTKASELEGKQISQLLHQTLKKYL